MTGFQRVVQVDVVEPLVPAEVDRACQSTTKNELCLDYLERRFGYRIVIRASRHAQGAAAREAVNEFVKEGVVKFTALIRMEQLNAKEAPFTVERSCAPALCFCAYPL